MDVTTDAVSRAGRALARAKAVCFRFVQAVKARDARMVQHVSDGLSREELAALAILLAEALPDLIGLKIVKDAEL